MFSCPQLAYIAAEITVKPSYICETLGICLRTNGVGQTAVTNSEHDSRLNLLAAVREAAKSRPERRWQYHDTVADRFRDDGPLKILQLTDIHLDVYYQEVMNDYCWHCGTINT